MKKFLSTLLTLSMVLTMLTTGAVFAASDNVQADADALTVDDILSVPAWNGNTLIDNLDIDFYTKGEVNESPISWTSSNNDVISNTGKVIRAAEDAEVTLTATIGAGDDAVTKDFTFLVPAASKTINGMPAVGTIKYEDDFSDSSINTSKIAVGALAATDSVVEENGKLVLTRSKWTTGEPYVELNHEINGNHITTYEFSLHSTSAYVRIPFIGYNWNGYPLYIHWYPNDNHISIGNGQTQDLNHRIKLPESARGKKAKFTVTFNAPKRTYDIWVNNELICSGNTWASGSQKPYKLRIVTLTSDWMYGVGSIAIDNLKVYECVQTDAIATYAQVNNSLNSALTYKQGLNNYLIGTKIDLTTLSGENGATVSYDISNTSVISETGNVTRALYDETVTITAIINTADGGQLVKAFKYIVPGKYNKIGRNTMPLINKAYPVSTSVTDTNTAGKTTEAELTAFSDVNGKISYTSVYTQKEPGFTLKYSDNLKQQFVQDMVFESTSQSLRITITDSAFGKKLVVYYLDGKTLAVTGIETATHTSNFSKQVIRLTLCYDMASNSADIYVNGELWLDDFALAAGSYKNIQYILSANMSATLLGTWRGGAGTTTFYSLDAYKVVDETAISPVMATDVEYSNEGVVAAGENTATVALVAGNESGEKACKLVYAIYSVEDSVKKLVGVDVVSANLDEFAHNKYTAKINLKDVPADAQQSLFIWTASGLVPVEATAFPVQ